MTPPDGNNTPTRPIRVPLDLWDAFGEAVEKIGVKDRSHYLREVMRWVIHDEGDPKPRMPRRPADPTPRRRAGQ
jgi:hypothetical protein